MLFNDALQQIFDQLFTLYGPQYWWPADSDFEIMVGAVLTQNTSWHGVELAIRNLKQADLLTPEHLLELPEQELAELIRPAGFYRVKAKRLRHLCEYLEHHGGLEALGEQDTVSLREGFLSVHGIGPETADDIVLYAYHRPVFVIDAYTRRLFSRLGFAVGKLGYEALRKTFESNLDPDVMRYQEYHALIVVHSKAVCRVKPRCGDCKLSQNCLFFKSKD
ncbi:MAG: endonuclease [bacterium]